MKLSYSAYGWKCVLGTEVIYVACLFYSNFLTGKGYEIHQSLFELLPFFSWSGVGYLVGGIYFFLLAWVFAGYYVWMFNSSLIER